MKVHEAPAGNPVHVKVTLPAYLAAPVTLSGTLALCPEVTVTVELGAAALYGKGRGVGNRHQGNGAELPPEGAKTRSG